MHDRRMKAALRRGLETANAPRPASGHRGRLEADLLDAYHEHYPRHRRFLMLLNPWNRVARLAMAGLAVALLGVGACSTSTITEVEMGQKLTIGLSDKSEMDFSLMDGEVERFLAGQPGVEGASINLKMIDGRNTLEIMVWGQDLDASALEAALRKQVPTLAEASVAVEPLTGNVRESLLAHCGHQYLGLEVKGETADEIRQQILTQLAAQGLDGDAQVQVENTPDGRKKVRVEIRQGCTTP
jgi:hypothetical protein